ncbi:hypothetical protein QCA50_020462 [Cerrena zonata]|uniref:Uncharacterized protein n=1 Tax=Cerrena zonata TaxID=2478898 RepID=A0AAW0F957_9APHY
MYSAFNCLRIWGICANEWAPTLLVFVFSLFDPAINIYNNVNPVKFIAEPSSGCWLIPISQPYQYCLSLRPVVTRSLSVATDAIILVLTLWKTRYIWETDRRVKSLSKITVMLIQNGFLQFFVLFISNIIVVILDILAIGNFVKVVNASYFIYIQQILTSILLSHFILDLRALNPSTQRTHNSSISAGGSGKVSLIEFAGDVWGSEVDEGRFIGRDLCGGEEDR